MNVIIGNQQGRTIKKLTTKAIASNGEICAHHSTPIDIFRAQLSLIEQEIPGFICQFLAHEHTHQIIYVRLMLKLASEIESVRITFRFSMPSNTFIPMKHLLTVSHDSLPALILNLLPNHWQASGKERFSRFITRSILSPPHPHAKQWQVLVDGQKCKLGLESL